MAYLHCHGCGWSQDDFWHGRDYPIRQDLIEWLRDLLLEDIIIGDGIEKIDAREFVASELEKLARRIRNMHIKTEEEFKRKKEQYRCPKCQSKEWDID